MQRFNRLGSLGALLLGLALIGYALYELVLLPRAGFPSGDVGVILAGANTLRVGHWLKFGYAISLALLVVGLFPRLHDGAAMLTYLGAISGSCAVALFLASGHLGLRILAIAEQTYATEPGEAITTILLRTVTIALFEAAIFAVGWYALLVNVAALQTGRLPRSLGLLGVVFGGLFILDRILPDGVTLIAPLGSIAWALGVGVFLWREMSGSPTVLRGLAGVGRKHGAEALRADPADE